jgi:cell division protein FtsN
MAGKKRRKKAEAAPGWAWMLFGLSIGLAVALVVYLKSGQPLIPERGREAVARLVPARSEPAARPAAEPQARLPEPASEPGPDAGTSATAGAGTDSADQQHGTELSFYDELAASTVEVNEGEFEFATETDTPQDVIIQAGSFPSADGADSRRASLAFLGYESSIERATVNGQTYHRVILGPFSEPGEINRTLRRLRSERIETVLRVVTN